MTVFNLSASSGNETRLVISTLAALGALTLLLAQDGAGRLSARLSHPAGPQAAFSRDPRGGSVTVPSAGEQNAYAFLPIH